MLAILSTLVAGVLIYYTSDFVAAVIALICGFAAFVIYAYIRSGMVVKDPVSRLALSVGEPTKSMRIERLISSILIPAGAAYLVHLGLDKM